MRRHVIRKSLGVSMSPLSRLSLINYLFTVFRHTVMQSNIKLQQLKKGIYAHGYWSPQVKGLSRSYPKIGTDPQDNDYDDEWVSISQLICTVYWTNMIMKQARIKKKTSVPWSYGKTYSKTVPLVSKCCCKKEKKCCFSYFYSTFASSSTSSLSEISPHMLTFGSSFLVVPVWYIHR